MAFFDELGKKLSQAGQSAVQKTKEVTDIARMNSVISDEEKKINNNYYQIGKLYVAIHASDYESDFASMIASIKDSEQKVVEYRQQIQDIKGIVRCEKCGAEVANNVDFCSSCGALMPKRTVTTDENRIKCTGCGQMVPKNMRFCTSCGKPMGKIIQVPIQTNAGNDQLPETPMSKHICPNCGVEVSEDSAFCTECGTKLK